MLSFINPILSDRRVLGPAGRISLPSTFDSRASCCRWRGNNHAAHSHENLNSKDKSREILTEIARVSDSRFLIFPISITSPRVNQYSSDRSMCIGDCNLDLPCSCLRTTRIYFYFQRSIKSHQVSAEDRPAMNMREPRQRGSVRYHTASFLLGAGFGCESLLGLFFNSFIMTADTLAPATTDHSSRTFPGSKSSTRSRTKQQIAPTHSNFRSHSQFLRFSPRHLLEVLR